MESIAEAVVPIGMPNGVG